MARTTATNFAGGLQFPYATAATDLFKKEDVQTLAQAVDQHTHATGLGLPIATVPASAIGTGIITSAMIADGTIDTVDLKDGAVTSAKILDGTIATGDIAVNAVSQWVTFQATVTFSTTTTAAWLASPASITMVTTGGRLVLEVSCVVSHSTGPSAVTYCGLIKDGTPMGNQAVMQNGVANQNITVCWVVSDQPTAASHTYQLGFYNATAGTFAVNAGVQVSMIATEYKR